MKSILFTPENQKTIRDRLKTQTRRLDHLKEINSEPDKWYLAEFYQATDGKWWAWFSKDGQEGKPYLIMPRYQVGERVYIKEVWATEERMDDKKPSFLDNAGDVPLWYKSDYSPATRAIGNKWDYMSRGKWRSPLFMPAWAARTFIKITDVRPERLQDITEEDAKAEGAEALYKIEPNTFGAGYIWTPHGYRDGFIKLWDSINPKYPFDGNWWVWRYCFNLIEDKR